MKSKSIFQSSFPANLSDVERAKLNSSLLLRTINKEITPGEAQSMIPCEVGRWGICKLHGQPIKDCK
jgi:hypothetical protein